MPRRFIRRSVQRSPKNGLKLAPSAHPPPRQQKPRLYSRTTFLTERIDLRRERIQVARKIGRIFIGTSGWNYKHWKTAFYPKGVASRDFLPFYAERFDSVEVNKSFYRLLKAKEVQNWAALTPPHFIFALKGSRFITHMLKLNSPKRALRRYFAPLSSLRTKMGPILFQLPPRWDKNKPRFENFLSALPPKYQYAFEFRDPRWISKDILSLLEERNMAFCVYDFAGYQSPLLATASYVYVRLHGPGAKYQGSYTERQLAKWEKWIQAQRREGRDAYCYFDNDQKAYAVKNAQELRQRLL